jgi:hypothetical protein
MNRDKAKLFAAIREAKLTNTQTYMAAILFNVNGLDNALEFIEKVKGDADEGQVPVHPLREDRGEGEDQRLELPEQP